MSMYLYIYTYTSEPAGCDRMSILYTKLNKFVWWESYPSYHNGLFLPLLVLRDFATRGRSLSVWHRSRCRVALRPAVLSAARIWPSVSRYLEISFGLRGPSQEGWVNRPAAEAPLTRGMPTGPRAFLANSGRVLATSLRPVSPQKRPCAIHARKVGRASNTADQYRC